MDAERVAPGLRAGWAALRRDLPFLPPASRLQGESQVCELEAVEFVRVVAADEEVQQPEAPGVPEAPVAELSGWSPREEDQQRMWPLVGRVVEGDRTTHTCPDCDGAKQVTCGHCRGRGRVSCRWCGGSGDESCSSCGGSGGNTVTRTTVNSDGSHSTTTERESCSSCGGSGRRSCSHCMGFGQERCSDCGGSGEVTCGTCSPQGTVDRFIRRTFRAVSLRTHLLPVALPGLSGPVTLSEGYVSIGERTAPHPSDAERDRPLLEERGIERPAARLFFIRPASVTVHLLRDPETGAIAASFIEGEPQPLLTLHRTQREPGWSPEQVRRRALAALLLYTLGPVAGLLFYQLAGGPRAGWIGLAPIALLFGLWWVAYRVGRSPVQTFRLALLDLRCTRHSAPACLRCPSCKADLCHECLLPSARCPQCGSVVSPAITHLAEDGRWVEASGDGPHQHHSV
ncbi:MAG: hypothetical protein ACOY93_23250 [Bacillota bacterium]